jgi:hypothetical protein
MISPFLFSELLKVWHKSKQSISHNAFLFQQPDFFDVMNTRGKKGCGIPKNERLEMGIMSFGP